MPAVRSEPPRFEDVAKMFSPPLRRYLERMAGNADTAEDLLQETLLRICRGLPGFEGRSSVKTWVFTIASRVAVDHLRKPDSKARIKPMEDEVEDARLAEDLGQPLVIDEMNACVRAVIDGLPADYRAALVLHDLEGLTAQAAAEACGCSLATAKIRIHRARKRLKAALEDECTFYEDDQSVLRCDRKSKPI